MMRIPKFRARFNAKVLAVVAIAAGALLASVLPGEAQVSADSPSVAAIRIESPATLQARGAAIVASALVVCTPGQQAFVSLSVSQRVGGDIAFGNGSADIESCTGGLQTVELNVLAQTSPFRKGTAFATANLFVGGFPSGEGEDQREIEIIR
jgi:hypothetical protein